MNIKIAISTLIFGALIASGQSTDPGVKPDNTKLNQRDRDASEATADQQKMNASDQELTRKIRRSVMADKSLSTYAHNVKIIAQDGHVTLKGPVRSEDEKKTILSKATAEAGGTDKVTDQLS